VAIFSGLMSSAMSFGLQGGSGIQKLALTMAPPTSATWAGMPVLVVVLLGGFIVNAGWCIILNIRKQRPRATTLRKASPWFRTWSLPGGGCNLVVPSSLLQTASRKWGRRLTSAGGSDGQLDLFARYWDLYAWRVEGH